MVGRQKNLLDCSTGTKRLISSMPVVPLYAGNICPMSMMSSLTEM